MAAVSPAPPVADGVRPAAATAAEASAVAEEAARWQQVRECLDRMSEAEALLAGVRQVEVVLAGVRHSLLDLCRSAPLGSGGEVPPTNGAAAAPAAALPSWPLVDPNSAALAPLDMSTAHSPKSAIQRMPPDQIVLCSVRSSGEDSQPVVDADALFSSTSGKDLTMLKRPNLNRTRTAVGATRKLGWKSADTRRGFLIAKAGCVRVPVFFPDSAYTLFWDLLGLMFIIFETFALPVYLSYGVQPEGVLFIFVSLVNVYFLMDIPINFIRGFKAANGMVVMLPASIAKRYSKWVGADILAGIPWEWLSSIAGHSKWAQCTKMLRLLRVARLLRLMRLDVLPDKAKMYVESNSWLSFIEGVIRVLFILFGVTHWAACIWFYIGSDNNSPNTWVAAHLPPDADFTSQYMYSLYFTLTTMTTVGYGDITPQNDTEVFVTLILLLIATVVFATLMGALTDLICSLQSESHTQDSRVRMLSSYMNWRQVPTDLFKAIRKHMLHLWQTNKGYDSYEQQVKDNLPPILRKELSYHVFGRVLRSATFLSWMWNYEACMKELANAVSSVIYSRGDSLFHNGQPNVSMFILLTGAATLTLNDYLHSESLLADNMDGDDTKLDSEHKQMLFEAAAAFEMQPNSRHSLVGNPSASSLPRDKSTPEGLQSPALMGAFERMQAQDAKEKWAACLIQRRWHNGRRMNRSRAKKHLGHLQTRTVDAPAYFGEACLWQPFDLWDAKSGLEPKHRYSVRCEMTSEVMIIPRAEIQVLINRFSPWLRDRFEQFRGYVMEESERLDDDLLGSPLANNCGYDEGVKDPTKGLFTPAERLAALALRSRASAFKLLRFSKKSETRPSSFGPLGEPLMGNMGNP